MKWLVVVLCGWAAIAVGCAPVQLTENTQRKFEEYKTQAYPDFKAFAFDPDSDRWGTGYGYRKMEQAIETALRLCGKTGAECEAYAIGNTVVSGMSQQQLAAAKEAYVARILGELDRSLKGKPLTSEELEFHLSGRTIKGTLNTGAGFVAEIGFDGTISARLFDTEQRSLGKLRRADSGTWWIEKGKFCRRFLQWSDGRTDCQDVVKDGDTIKFYSSGELVSQGVIVEKN